MSYLQALKDAVSKAFADCQDKKAVDSLVEINTAIEKADGEMASLMEKNKELIAAYKDAVMHPGVTEKPVQDDVTIIGQAKEIDIRDFIQTAINAKEN